MKPDNVTPPGHRSRLNIKAAVQALRDAWPDSEKPLITNVPPAALTHPSAAEPPAAPHLTAPDLPTAGEWVRGLLAKGFVPVKIEVIDPMQKARAPVESPNPPTVDSPESPGEAEPAEKHMPASGSIDAKGMELGAWVRGLMAQGLTPAGPMRIRKIEPPPEA